MKPKQISVEGFWCGGGCEYLVEGMGNRCTLFNQPLDYESYEQGDATYRCQECRALFTLDKLERN